MLKDKRKIAIAISAIIIICIVIAVVLIPEDNSVSTPSDKDNVEYVDTDGDGIPDSPSNDNNGTDMEDRTPSPNVVYDKDDTVLYDAEDEKILDIAEIANDFDYMTIVKTISETTMTNSGNEEEIISVHMSDIDLIRLKDCTIDRLAVGENDPFTAPRLNFEEVFGFSYKEYDNMFDVQMKVVKEAGIDTDFDGYDFSVIQHEDAEIGFYHITNENLPIIQEIIADIDYDKIIHTECNFNLYEDNDDNFAKRGINYANAVVTYEKDGVQKIRQITYRFMLHREDFGWQ